MSEYDDTFVANIYSDEMVDEIIEYLRDESLTKEDAKKYWHRAVSYIENYTGLTRERLEKLPDLVHPMLAIITDMHDNRQYVVDKNYINQLVATTLDMYRENLV